MNGFAQTLGDRLAQIYRNIIKLEEKAIKDGEIGLTMSEVHLLTHLHKHKDGVSVSEIARTMGVSKPTVTVAVNRMVKREYAVKESGGKDGRRVRVKLTEEGKRIVILHRRSQRKVIKSLGNEFTDEQRDTLLKAIDKLNLYFNKAEERKENEI